MIQLFSLFLSIKGRMNFLGLNGLVSSMSRRIAIILRRNFRFWNSIKPLLKNIAVPIWRLLLTLVLFQKAERKLRELAIFGRVVQEKQNGVWRLLVWQQIDCENHTAFHLESVQTMDLKEDQTLVQYYLNIILERKNELQELSKNILVDAYFSKHNFVDPIVEEGFTIISRLRDDADLRYNFEGEQKPGKGRPRK